jgi:acetoin utilization protein AcuC
VHRAPGEQQAAAASPRAGGAPPRAWFLGSDTYRRPAYRNDHPLAIPRASLVADLCRALGWLDDGCHVDSPRATVAELTRFHDPSYVAAVRRASREGRASAGDRERYGLGTRENPVFPGLFERAATACGGSMEGARRILDGGTAFNPAGGTHHGLAAHAHGFCYFNDPVLAILTLLDAGLERVFYADFDAHHGDGVQAAFAGEPRVFTLSVHEAGRWPGSGALDDRGAGNARNLPVPAGFNDAELRHLLHHAVVPLSAAFEPQAVVITVGADALAGDPLSRLALGNTALWEAVQALRALSPRTLVLGGGGYNPWTLGRCWTGLWGVLCGERLPALLPDPARALLAGLECDLVDEDEVDPRWLDTLADPPGAGPVRAEVARLAGAALAA